MLRQICRRGRLAALVHDMIKTSRHTKLKSALSILIPKSYLNVTKAANTPNIKKRQPIPDDLYSLFLSFLNSESSTPIRHFNQLPHPDNATILSPTAVPKSHIEHKKRTYSVFSNHAGNSSISFRSNGDIEYGQIKAIWTDEINKTTDLLVVSTYHRLSDHDNRLHPYSELPGLLCSVVYSESTKRPPNLIIIRPEQIIGHIGSLKRPAGTFGIRDEIVILVDSLHRNRQ